MERLFSYIETEFKKKFNLKLTNKNDEFIIKNNYYSFKLKKRGETFVLSYFWKYGLLNIIFKKQYNNMFVLHDAIMKYSKKNFIPITEIHYNK